MGAIRTPSIKQIVNESIIKKGKKKQTMPNSDGTMVGAPPDGGFTQQPLRPPKPKKFA